MKNNLIEAYAREKFNNFFHTLHIKSMLFFLQCAISAKSLVPVRVGQRARTSMPRHGIKRVHRLLKNNKIKQQAMQNCLLADFKYMIKGLPQVILAIDWTTVRTHFNLFSISLVLGKGRTIPILFDGYKKKELKKLESQPKIEQNALLKVFKQLGKRRNVVILADRGFDSPDTLEFIAGYGYYYVIRAKTSSNITFCNGHNRELDFSIIKRGEKRLFKNIKYTDKATVKTNLAAFWAPAQNEPWLLLSNLNNYSVQSIVNYYSKRVEIEEMFKSMKNEMQGFQIKQVKLRHLDRWLRFMFLTTVLFRFLGYMGIAVRNIANIEKRYSLSSKVPKKQKFIFSFYRLPMLVLYDTFAFKYYRRTFFFKDSGTNWLPLN